MYRHRHWPDELPEDEAAERRTASLAGIVIILVLLIGGLFLVQQLRTASQLQDCLLAGRRSCNAVLTGAH